MDSIKPLQRANTLPTRLRHSLGAVDKPDLPNNGVLYFHRSVKIVKFELPQSAQIAPPSDISSDLDYVVDTVETLPWRASTERIVALGHMKIEHVLGSTIFLKSGSVVQTLMKNCQCWCVDAQSIFVIRIRRLTYYRIELPYETKQDKEQVEELKRVLSTIIRYEVTPCPFKRGFSVELPEEAKTPKRKKAWRPKLDPSYEFRKLDFGETSYEGTEYARSDAGSTRADTEGDMTDASADTPKAYRKPVSDYERSPPISIPKRSVKNVTEPTYTFDSLMARFQALPDSEESEMDEGSLSSSVDSFHSFQSISPLPPSPPYSNPLSTPESQPFVSAEEIHIPQRSHNREMSEATVVPDATTSQGSVSGVQETQSHAPISLFGHSTNLSREKRGITTSTLSANLDSAARPRLRDSRKREFSPMPPPSTILVSETRSPVNSITTSVLHKTCSLVIGAPIQVLAILLHIAARLAKGDRSQSPNSEESAHRRNISTTSVWSEDDFGIPLSSSASTTAASSSRDNYDFELWGDDLD
ncbi:hypothetical protein AJ79_09934 [Helicocarpus griseus UAMH5409]|uniref:Inheritance of peroxisomes protein 1 n=1 Tax=Helicocarpus griseus UAMH5409 TaxID=1447875 RepID=A0A2B7W7Z3_9EURO|nr:hypothetical protein AJ79_09934 [Helicocarpus griseus UAMH5409]